ncbi:hypothetical protein J2S43_007543 [Catenuloplanes nepalensis]|uniref:DUF4873 domain-containing protein n=1 Tax=Catenuloplanes nepalensis TaxID=587533 RepID=A0ABT9N5S4_9ACTN|nr:hypothetical protein [Catenuloplanes nepalensis]MDP9799031.1 hypothetical protein [Catenuloplanes nepalensis]
MGTYIGNATLFATDGTAQTVQHASIRTRRDADTGVVTWTGTVDLSDGEIADLLLPSGDGTLRLPDGTEAAVRFSPGGAFTGTATAG